MITGKRRTASTDHIEQRHAIHAIHAQVRDYQVRLESRDLGNGTFRRFLRQQPRSPQMTDAWTADATRRDHHQQPEHDNDRHSLFLPPTIAVIPVAEYFAQWSSALAIGVPTLQSACLGFLRICDLMRSILSLNQSLLLRGPAVNSAANALLAVTGLLGIEIPSSNSNARALVTNRFGVLPPAARPGAGGLLGIGRALEFDAPWHYQRLHQSGPLVVL